MFIRSLIENNNKKIEIKHINSRSSAEIMAPLLKYDSVHGKFNCEITNGKNYLNINDKFFSPKRKKNFFTKIFEYSNKFEFEIFP